jgi:hypothetical protein
MAKRLSRVAMVKETGEVEAVDKTKLAFSGPQQMCDEINCGKC